MSTSRCFLSITCLAGALVGPALGLAEEPAWKTGAFRWQTGEPVVLPADVPGDETYSIKDPSIVRYQERWHLFCTIRGKKRSHAIVYLSFADWKDAGKAKRQVLGIHPGFCAAPQVFYFTPHKKWYLLCQAADESWEPRYQPAYATSGNLADPTAWTALKPLFGGKPGKARAWLDFWIICDRDNAYLFFTSLDGKMWRSRTKLADFPRGWSEPALALQGDIFEASHTYRLQGVEKYLTLIEAQNGQGWRYYKAYVADRLDGKWKPLAAEKKRAFASMGNVEQNMRWTDSISHGELLRAGHDERLEVGPNHLRFLFQGVLDSQRRGKKYGEIPWRLGILEPVHEGK
jgi:hypothetical protein